ncbi:MAG: cyclic nucleotide-binding domain-containing protein [Candidatus Hadarchaeales archaeon]
MPVQPERLRVTDLFEHLSFQELQDIAAIAQEEEYEAGHVLFKPGDRAEKIYLIEKGRVSIEIEITPTERIGVYVLGEGNFFGYPALLPSKTYTTVGTCLERTKLITIEASRLLSLLEKDPKRGFKVMQKVAELIAKKLADTRRQLVFCVLPPTRA